MKAPGQAAGAVAAPALGSVLPIFWTPESSWPANLQRWKERYYGKRHHLGPGGYDVNERNQYAQLERK
jgi:hypothetical protein